MAANPIDLITLADAKAYLKIKTAATGDDVFIQSLITGISQYWLTRTCRISLSSVATITRERYNGTNKDTLMLRQFPIRTVPELLVDGMPISESTDYMQPGWVINPERNAIVLIGTRAA